MDAAELGRAMTLLGLAVPSAAALRALVASVDTDGSGAIEVRRRRASGGSTCLGFGFDE
jgi:hypothetical protein